MTPVAYLAPVNTAGILFPFSEFEGTIRPVQKKLERVVRRGVNGIGIINTGQRGDPFTIKTSCDYSSFSAAQSAFSQYRSYTGSQLDLYQRGTRLGSVLVGNVDEDMIEKTGLFINGINVDGSLAVILRATWTFEMLY